MTDPITQQQFITAGTGKAEPLFLEDVFRSDYYTGNTAVSSGHGPDLLGEGGMTWTKCTSATQYWSLRDTVRGANKWMSCADSHGDQTGNGSYAFLNNGQTSGTDGVNGDSNQQFTSASFRKAKGFFDVVTWTGNSTNRTISHSLGCVPGAIVVKRTDGIGSWMFGHKGLNGGTNPWNYHVRFNASDPESANHQIWNNTAPTDSNFSIGTNNDVNETGGEYIAYLWASGDADSQLFGREGAETNIIKCGSYTGNGGSQTIDVGFHPDWYIIKQVTPGQDYDWSWWDKYGTGGVSTTGYGDGMRLRLNTNAGRAALMRMLTTAGGNTSTRGFYIHSEGSNFNGSGKSYIYIAVRSPDMHVCRDGSTGTDGENGVASQYFTTSQGNNASNNPNGCFPANFAPDAMYFREYVSSDSTYMATRDMKTQSGGYTWQMNNGSQKATTGISSNAWFSSKGMHRQYNNQYQAWMWKKGPGMTHVWYYGNGQSGRTIYHDLGAVPELIFWKALDRNDQNPIWHYGLNNGVNAKYYMVTSDTRGGQYDARGDWIPNTAAGLDPTSTYFKVGPNSPVNNSSSQIVCHLYRSVPGMSKVGYYQGNSSGLTITTGFQPRYMWLKRTNTSDSRFYYLDTVRGWGAGNDEWLEFSDQAGQQGWDFGAPTSTGFTLTGGNSHTNADNNNYIYYAHA